jgi:hypothetical protein
MQSVQQLVEWTPTLHSPFQAMKSCSYTRSSNYTWWVHGKRIICNRNNMVCSDGVLKGMWHILNSNAVLCIVLLVHKVW